MIRRSQGNGDIRRSRRKLPRAQNIHDLKEFWHVGRTMDPVQSAGHHRCCPMSGHPVPEFKETFETLYAEMDKVGGRILSSIARYLELPVDWFDSAIADGNSILRLLHYPPIEGDAEGCIRAGAHEDINLITLLTGRRGGGSSDTAPRWQLDGRVPARGWSCGKCRRYVAAVDQPRPAIDHPPCGQPVGRTITLQPLFDALFPARPFGTSRSRRCRSASVWTIRIAIPIRFLRMII